MCVLIPQQYSVLSLCCCQSTLTHTYSQTAYYQAAVAWRYVGAFRPRPVQGLAASELLYEVKQPAAAAAAAGQPFALTVTRKATGQPVFNTQGHR
jgi:hypothetical protein